MMTRVEQEEYQYVSEEYAEGTDIFSLLVVLWRRKFTLLFVLILGIVMAFVLVMSATPRYIARGHVLVQLDNQGFSIDQLLSSKRTSIFDVGSVLTELEVLKSRKLAGRVVKKLNLVNDANLQTLQTEPNVPFDPFSDQSNARFKNVIVDGTALKTLPPEAIDPKVSAIVTAFLENLKVVSVPGSRAVKVNYTSYSPEKAALIVNTLIDEYRSLKLSEKLETQKRVSEWLDGRLVALQQNLLDLETKIQNHKTEHNLFPEKQDVITTRQITNLNEQYVETKEKTDQLRSQINQLSGVDSVNTLIAMNLSEVNTALIRRLQSDKIVLNTRIADLSNRYGAKHPTMIKAQTELKDVQSVINREFKKAKSVLKNELQIVQSRLDEIEKSIGQGGEQFEETQDPKALAYLNSLEREAEASRLVLKTFLESYNKSIGKAQLEESGVEIISHASVPTIAAYPNKMLIFALSIFTSLIMGIFLVIILEKVALMEREAVEP